MNNTMPIDIYHKGWTKPEYFNAFREAVKSGDCHDISKSVNAEGAERKPVDAYVNAMRLPRQPSGSMPILSEIMTDERRAELELTYELSKQRDDKISNMPDSLPLGMREVSLFLEDQKVPRYAKGKDYVTTEKQYKEVIEGKTTKKITRGPVKNIVTLRDGCSYVHSDSPFELWGKVVDLLLEWGVPQRLQSRINDHDGQGQSRFTVYGSPFMHGLIGYAILMAGPVSFAAKWKDMVARPEQLCFEWLNMLLSQAYPEGSPMHPSRPAMHSFAALVCCYVLTELFDEFYELPNGRQLGAELRLLADNVGYFRVFAGVHYPSDHDDAVELAKATAHTVVRGFI